MLFNVKSLAYLRFFLYLCMVKLKHKYKRMEAKITTKTKQELASEYFPYIGDHSALNRLRAWINGCPELSEKLAMTGYAPRQRILTGQQVGLVYEYLGEP